MTSTRRKKTQTEPKKKKVMREREGSPAEKKHVGKEAKGKMYNQWLTSIWQKARAAQVRLT